MKQGGNTATIVPTVADGLELEAVPAGRPVEELDGQLDDARQQLLDLRRQQEELERQKGELEELRRKQDEYTRGRAEMLERLTRGLVTLDREQIQAQRLAELSATTATAFRDYLEQLQSINDEDWTAEDLRLELSHALGVIENARLEYNRARTKLDCLNPSANQPAAVAEPPAEVDDWPEFVRYAKLGAAASAPLIVSVTVWFIVWLVLR